MPRYLIWDFDGTLGFRMGGWTSALVDVLREKAPECRATADDLRPHIQTGYPWHAPDQNYPVRLADQWWEDLAPVFERAFTSFAAAFAHRHMLLVWYHLLVRLPEVCEGHGKAQRQRYLLPQQELG